MYIKSEEFNFSFTITRATTLEPAVDCCHFVRSRAIDDADGEVAQQNLRELLHDIALALALIVEQHAPYLPYWQLLVRQPTVVSICYDDFETIFLLVSPLNAEMPLSQRVPKSSGTFLTKIGKNKEKIQKRNNSPFQIKR